MAVVKADGYGHGLVPAARAVLAGGADYLGVAVLDEALALRAAGRHRAAAGLAARPRHRLRRRRSTADVEVSVNAEWGLAEVVAAARATGRHRPGAPVRRHRALPRGRDPRRLARPGRGRRPRARPTATSPSSGCGATWPTPTRPPTRRSAPRCGCSRRPWRSPAAAGLTEARPHLANSAATIALPGTWYDLVRPGVALYGLDPLGGDPAAHGLRPAMTVRAPVALTKRVPAGVGRLLRPHLRRPSAETTLALVPVGYADGVPRAAGNRAPVLAAGAQRTIAGPGVHGPVRARRRRRRRRAGRRGRPLGCRATAASRPRRTGPTPSTPSTTSWSPGSVAGSAAATSARPGRV